MAIYTYFATRDAISGNVEHLIVGVGFAGLIAAVNLQGAGIDDYRIVDTAGDFGGTWYWNRYPGVQCDIESYCYLPWLEEVGYIPKERYAYGSEILEHCQRIGRHFGYMKRPCSKHRSKAWFGIKRCSGGGSPPITATIFAHATSS